MPRTASPSSVTEKIQTLIEQRQQHADAISAIDQTLAQINGLLGDLKPGRTSVAAATVVSPAAPPPKKGRRRRARFETTGTQSILAFIQQRGNPTTKEINAHWKQEGRGATADTILGELVKAKKLRRKSLGARLGSEYSLASAVPAPTAVRSAVPARKRGRGTYGTTAEQMVLDFVRQKGKPTTQEIKDLWTREGRNGRADNELSRLVGVKKLKRTPIPGARGSQYRIA